MAERRDVSTGTDEIIAVGRLSRLGTSKESELAVLVSDRYQHQGLGMELGRRLVVVARNEKAERIVASVLAENSVMRSVLRQLGFQTASTDDPTVLLAVLDLQVAAAKN